tara:strand:+ start:2185 stop:3315 length:1131 start_codon:yes stop_codon:yes gene_type:complete
MKTLFVGVYKDGTGWGNAAQNYILALDAAGVDVIPRHLKINNTETEVPERILELEKKDISNCNVVIQNLLPYHMEYNGNFDKNIGLYFTETDSIVRSGWAEHINLMDEAWVANSQSENTSKSSGVTVPITTLPVPVDTSIYETEYDNLYKQLPQLKDNFVFYFVGEVTRRKNLVALLKAFHLEFSPYENVHLLIKANLSGLSDDECSQRVQEMCETVKRELKLYKNPNDYKQELILCQNLSQELMMVLHNTCDCFVMPSFGEGWCMPAFDAMAMGNTPIVNNIGGMREFINDENGWLVKNTKEPVFGMGDTSFPKMFTGRENWWSIDIIDLMRCMREAYENNEERKKKSDTGINNAYDFSLSKIGREMKDAIKNTS